MTLTSRLAIAMIALVAAAVTAVGWLSYHNVEQALVPRMLDRIEKHAQLVASELQSYTRSARADVASFRASTAGSGLIAAHLNGGVNPADHVSEAVWRERLTARLAAELAVKPAYSQFRLIGIENGQRELVRVDRSGPNGAIRVVPDAELQPKGNRPYFSETLKLPKDEIYVSPLDLNQENGALETPYVPTLRVATAIFASDGKPFGIFIINIDMRPAFDQIRAATPRGGMIYAVNARGEYLVHPDRGREFGAQRNVANDWPQDFPVLAPARGATQVASHIVPDQDGARGGITLAPAVLAGKEWVGIIETVSNAVIMSPAKTIQHTTLAVGLVAVLCAAILAFLIARSLARPIAQLTSAVEGFDQGKTSTIPVDAGGETGVLARAFARLMSEASARTLDLEREVSEHRRTEVARDHHAERERLFSAAVESSSDAIIIKSMDGTISGWNPAAERLYGYTAAEAVGRHVSLIIPPHLLAEEERAIERLGMGERIEQNETVRLRKDGTPVEISLSMAPIRSASGAIIGVTKSARDITERNRTLRAIKQQAEELRRIFETSQDLILVMDPRGRIIQVSPSCEAILGYRAEALIGRSGDEFIHPADIEVSRNQLRRARRSQRMKIPDVRIMHTDGRAVWLSWLGTWSEPAERYFFVGRDMTESHAVQETLQESAALARGIIDTALDAFVQVDQRATIRDWNAQAAAMFGWSRQEALGKNMFKMLGRADGEGPLKQALDGFLNSGLDQVVHPRREVKARRRDGREFTAELSVAALRTRDGFVFNAFVRDLTDKIANEERIRQSEKMEAVGQLTGGIAHDFNNILTVITGTIEILADAVKDRPQLAAITRMIDEAASRGADLTQHLLAFARKQPLEPRETDINQLIMDTTKLLHRTLGEQVEIDAVFEDEVCLASVDPNQLATAILNLSLNARDAMPEGGKLMIETGSVVLDDNYARMHGDVRPGHYAMIAVTDTGTGIPAGIIDKVFNPFFTSKGPGKGTGLGLSMVYGFIKQSSGHIKIYSEEGVGTTIKMYLPPATGLAAAPESVLPPDALQGGHETILVVEDDKLVRDYVLTQLHSLGYVTLDAENANQALAIVNSGHAFDLLFTDVIMPGQNGRQLADEMLKIRPGLKVLFTSGYTENAIIHHGRLDEGVLLLAKPYRKSDMAIMIRKALAA